MRERKELIHLEFRHNRWIPPPYLLKKEDVDILDVGSLTEQSLLGDNDILSEGEGLIRLILFLTEDFNKFLSGNSLIWKLKLFRYELFKSGRQIGVLIGFAALSSVFKSGPVLAQERLLSPMNETSASVSHISESNGLGKVLKSPHFAQLLRQGLVLKGSELLAAEEVPLRALRGAGPIQFMGDGDLFHDFTAFDTKTRTPPLRALPKQQGLHHSSAFQDLPKTARRDSLKLNASTLNKSALPSKIDTLLFTKVWHPVEGRGDSLVTEALKPTHQDNDFKGYKAKNLRSIQKITWDSVILNKTDKIKALRAMNKIIIELSDELDKLKKESKEVWATSADMDKLEKLDRDINKLEEVIRLERNQKEYHSLNTLNLNYTTVANPRAPSNPERDGSRAVSFQGYDRKKLSEEEKKLVPNGLTSFFDDYIKKEQDEKNTPRKEEQFTEIAGKTLQFCIDANNTRIRFAKIVYDGAVKKISWDKRRAPCEYPWYKNDLYKSRLNLVDKYLLNQAKSKLRGF